jgi:hypothetical protein
MIFRAEDGKIEFDVTLDQDTAWLTQAQMAVLFDKGRVTITEHIDHVFKERELDQKSVCRKFRRTASDGKKYETQYYSLDVIISVGYRVKSQRGTQFRIWANSVLKDYLIKGYATNTKRLIEKKLELEIKESSKMMADILMLKGIEVTGASELAVGLVANYLGRTLDEETMVLKAHILTERFLIQFLKTTMKNKKVFDEGRFTYRNILTLSRAQHDKNEKEWVWELLGKLNQIRNDYAHVLEGETLKSELVDFIRVSKLRMKSKGISIPKETADLKTILVHLCGTVYGSFVTPKKAVVA